MSELQIDLNIDKHNRPTLVIECPHCKHELTHHLETLPVDGALSCDQCAEQITVSAHDQERARRLYEKILLADDGLIS